MQFANAFIDEKPEFILSFGGTKEFFLWRDYKDLFLEDKSIQSINDLGQLIEQSALILSHLRQYEIETRQLTRVTPLQFLLPFRPKQFRDFYCFEEHVSAGRKNRGLEILPEWYEFPVFYFSNVNSFIGPDESVPGPQDSSALDLELEIACVLGKKLKNANLAEAREAIFAYTLLNDWSARDLQLKEMKLNLGPAKGKDFATSFGPILITPDEISGRQEKKGYDIEFEALINGVSLTKRKWSSIHYSFEEMIVQASKNTWLYPGEVIASGTMGGGCLLEHNFGKDKKIWLKPGDEVELRWLPDGPRLRNQIEK